MDTFVNIFYWILLFTWGFLVLKYRRQIKSFSGDFVWAETYLWRWTTYLIIIIIWCFLIFLWALYPFWWIDFIFWK